MSCQRCKGERIISVNGKCSDLCSVSIGGKSSDGYVPEDLGIGGGDYIEFRLCLDCGQLQGQFPVPPVALEKVFEDDSATDLEGDDEAVDLTDILATGVAVASLISSDPVIPDLDLGSNTDLGSIPDIPSAPDSPPSFDSPPADSGSSFDSGSSGGFGD